MTSDGDGRIIRSTGGFYYVDTGSEIVDEKRVRDIAVPERRPKTCCRGLCLHGTHGRWRRLYRRTSAP